jgi:hypothetical protein
MSASLMLVLERAEHSARDGQQGYEARHMASALWVYSIMAFIDSERDAKTAAINASLAFALNPIPISEVTRAFYFRRARVSD